MQSRSDYKINADELIHSNTYTYSGVRADVAMCCGAVPVRLVDGSRLKGSKGRVELWTGPPGSTPDSAEANAWGVICRA